MSKINLDTIRKYAGKGLEVALYGAGVLLSYVSITDVLNTVRYSGNVKYSDAVNVIMHSSMLSSDKNEAVSNLKTDCDAEFYRAIIQITKSSMMSSDKVKLMKNLNEK